MASLRKCPSNGGDRVLTGHPLSLKIPDPPHLHKPHTTYLSHSSLPLETSRPTERNESKNKAKQRKRTRKAKLVEGVSSPVSKVHYVILEHQQIYL